MVESVATEDAEDVFTLATDILGGGEAKILMESVRQGSTDSERLLVKVTSTKHSR